MTALEQQIRNFLDERRRENVSPHTLRNYGMDLAQFAGEFPAPPDRWTVLVLRGWLAELHTLGLSPVTIRRKIAALRSFFQYLLKLGLVEFNAAKMFDRGMRFAGRAGSWCRKYCETKVQCGLA